MRATGRGRALAAIFERAGFHPGPPAGVRCVPFPRHRTEVTRGPGSGRSSQQALPAAAMPSVQLPPKESALFKRVLVSGGAATHPTSARFVYLRAGLPRGSPPPRAASAASVLHGGRFPETSWPWRWGPGVWAPDLCGSRLGASPPRCPYRESRLLRGQAGGTVHHRPSRERVTAVGGAGIEPAVLGSRCHCAGEFACVWWPRLGADLPETLASNSPE